MKTVLTLWGLILGCLISCACTATAHCVDYAISVGPWNHEVAESDATQRDTWVNLWADLRPSFIENKGQLDAQVPFYVRGLKATAFFTRTGVVLSIAEQKPDLGDDKDGIPLTQRVQRGEDNRARKRKFNSGVVARMSFVDANPNVTVRGREELPGKVNIFKGNDPSKWLSNIRTYGEVMYHELWPGIDLVYRGDTRGLKHDFVIKPGANPDSIRIRYEGVESLSISETGDLIISTAIGNIFEKTPFIYQEIKGVCVEVKGGFRIVSENVVCYHLSTYEPAFPIVIDPRLVYSTYLGGTSTDVGWGIALDDSGNAYVAGETFSTDFPTTLGAFNESHNGGYSDAFVVKLNPEGTDIVYSTFLGGSDYDFGHQIAVDDLGNAYVAGTTHSNDFPTTSGAFDGSINSIRDLFVAKLNSTGSDLLYSTYIGGSEDEYCRGIAVDDSDSAYLTGTTMSDDFPVTSGAFDESYNGGSWDAFVTKLDSAGTDLVYSTFLGGTDHDQSFSMDVDESGNAYVTGRTESTDFPTTLDSFDESHNGSFDAFVTKLDSAGTNLVYSMFLGGSNLDYGKAIAVDGSDNAYIAGHTYSDDFPIAAGAYNESYNGEADVFIAKVNSDGSSLVYSTYLGGTSSDFCDGIALDDSGNAYVAGGTKSTDFPTTPGTDKSLGGDSDAFVLKLNSTGSDLVYSTYLGGSSGDTPEAIFLDDSSNAYLTGSTHSDDFPTTPGAFEECYGLGTDSFVCKMYLGEDWKEINLAKAGGSGMVKINDGEPQNLPLSLMVPTDDVVKMEAVPDVGSEFISWSGDFVSTDNPAFVAMDTDKNITTNFTVYYTLSIDKTGNGLVKVDDVPHELPWSDSFLADGTVILQAVPDTGWDFEQWSGDLTGTNNPDSIQMDDNKNIIAIFEDLMTYYVNGTTGNDWWDGLAPEWDGSHGPFKTIHKAIVSSTDGYTIIIAEGVYETHSIDFSVGLPSGTRNLELRSENGPANTIIDCEGLGRGFNFQSGEGLASVVDGFTITNGQADDGGGIRCDYSSPTIRNCIITNNTATGTFGHGGGIFITSSSNPQIVNCVIANNAAKDGGGIYYGNNSNPLVTDCVVSHNTSVDDGGGISCHGGSNPVVKNCVVTSNSTSNRGGGIWCAGGGSTTIANCIVVHNSSSDGAGISCVNSDPSIDNCTVVENWAQFGGGIYCENSSPIVTNCILWGDNPDEIHVASGSPLLTYCDIEGGWSGIGWNILDDDPLFVSGMLHDYYLSQIAAGQGVDSPCVDTGSDTAVNLGLDEYVTRIDGLPDEDIVDMGYHAPYALWIYSITRNGDDITIRWNSLSGVSYTVQHSTDMEIWTDVPVGEVGNWTDPDILGSTKKFYRVLEQ